MMFAVVYINSKGREVYYHDLGWTSDLVSATLFYTSEKAKKAIQSLPEMAREGKYVTLLYPPADFDFILSNEIPH